MVDNFRSKELGNTSGRSCGHDKFLWESRGKWRECDDSRNSTEYCHRTGDTSHCKLISTNGWFLRNVVFPATDNISGKHFYNTFQRDIEEETELDHMKPSLKFRLKPGLEKLEWNFGYPADTYTGSTPCIHSIDPLIRQGHLFSSEWTIVEVRTPRLGLFQVLDSYDPVGRPIAYDFHFAFISFCDLSKASSKRSSHQLDGKR